MKKFIHFYLNKRFYSVKDFTFFKKRGILNDFFPKEASQEISQLLASKPQCLYAGFDPTAESLHVGNLLILFNLLWWQRAGHKIIALIGGATAQIGDPSGRTSERDEIALEIVKNNTQGIRKNIETIFSNHERFFWKENIPLQPIRIVDNSEWYSKISAIELCGRIGRHFRLGTMVGRSSVQTRLKSEEGMNFAEFCYQIFQSYDWLHLHREFQCTFQIGGSDQMGNIVAGYDLISRVANSKVYGLTLPLITSESGNKYGKSAGNAVWLDINKTSAFDFYQFFLRSKDSEIEYLLKLFTFEEDNKIKEIMEEQNAAPEKRYAQTYLAQKSTLLVHGEEGLASAERITNALYSKNPESSIQQLKPDELRIAFSGATQTTLTYEPQISILKMALDANCFKREDDARRIITAGGFYINSQRITDCNQTVENYRLSNGITLLRVGKKNYTIINWAN